MDTVYVVTRLNFASDDVQAVFSTRAAAMAYVAEKALSDPDYEYPIEGWRVQDTVTPVTT